MVKFPASIYASAKARALTDRLGVSPVDLPAGGNWYPDETVLELMVDLVEEIKPLEVVVCGSGISVPVLALACRLAGRGHVSALEHDDRARVVTASMLFELGLDARLHRAELIEYDKHNFWYARWAIAALPESIDLLIIDGPGHFAGRSPRWPAGPELFPSLRDSAAVLLDDGHRVKERKALAAWAREFPLWQPVQHARGGNAVVLRQQGAI